MNKSPMCYYTTAKFSMNKSYYLETAVLSLLCSASLVLSNSKSICNL